MMELIPLIIFHALGVYTKITKYFEAALLTLTPTGPARGGGEHSAVSAPLLLCGASAA